MTDIANGVIATETILWLDPELVPPPADSLGIVYLCWVRLPGGAEVMKDLSRQEGGWLEGEAFSPSWRQVLAYAVPPRGPRSPGALPGRTAGAAQHGAPS